MIGKGLDRSILTMTGPVSADDECVIPPRGERVLYSARKLRRKRICKVRQQDSDNVGGRTFQAPGQPVRRIMKLFDNLLDRPAHLRADIAIAVYNARHGHGSHAASFAMSESVVGRFRLAESFDGIVELFCSKYNVAPLDFAPLPENGVRRVRPHAAREPRAGRTAVKLFN